MIALRPRLLAWGLALMPVTALGAEGKGAPKARAEKSQKRKKKPVPEESPWSLGGAAGLSYSKPVGEGRDDWGPFLSMRGAYAWAEQGSAGLSLGISSEGLDDPTLDIGWEMPWGRRWSGALEASVAMPFSQTSRDEGRVVGLGFGFAVEYKPSRFYFGAGIQATLYVLNARPKDEGQDASRPDPVVDMRLWQAGAATGEAAGEEAKEEGRETGNVSLHAGFGREFPSGTRLGADLALSRARLEGGGSHMSWEVTVIQVSFPIP